jgi:hypothetical protein
MEGVNLGAVFDDTNQVSVIRGASFLLREATQQLPIPKYILPDTWEVISSGASIGLFSFEAENFEHAENVRKDVVHHLNTDEKFRHFSFVVDIQPATAKEFPYDKEAVLARNRFRQMQQLSLVVPEKNHSENSTIEICTLTNLTPAYKKAFVGEEQQFVSSSVQVRLKHGREQKQVFYKKETGIDLDFTQDLQEIADSTGQLKNKIAVLYLDGNKFSSIQEKQCTTPDALQKFDRLMQDKRREFLTALLQDCIIPDKGFFNHDLVRLETLLWGGDEMLLVVPASKGLRLLQFFYEFTKDWKFKDNDLTHAGGLVFCRAKTPIRRIRKFAQELADAVKEKNREESRFDYMVLESIDYPSESLEKLREKIFQELIKDDDKKLDYKVLKPFNSEMLGALRYLKKSVPKTKAYDIVRAKDKTAFKKERERLSVVLNDKKIDTEIDSQLDRAFPEQQIDPKFPEQTKWWQWLHLVELWDYIEESEISLTAPPTP